MKEKNKKTKYNLKVKSKIHPDIYHLVFIDFRCYEKMPKETEFKQTKEYMSISKIKEPYKLF